MPPNLRPQRRCLQLRRRQKYIPQAAVDAGEAVVDAGVAAAKAAARGAVAAWHVAGEVLNFAGSLAVITTAYL